MKDTFKDITNVCAFYKEYNGGVEEPDEKINIWYLFGPLRYLFGRIRICSDE